MRKRIAYIALILALLMFYVWTNRKMSFFACAFLVGILLISTLINQWNVKKVKIRYDIDVTASGNFIVIDVENSSVFPINHIESVIRLENIVFDTSDTKKVMLSVAGKSREQFRLPIMSKYCGRVDLRVERCLVYDWMDLAYRSVEAAKEGFYYEYPVEKYQHIETIKDGVSEGEETTYKNVVGNDISEILQIREYRRGDTIKNIHWKLTAKSGKILVKELNTPNDNSIMVIFDYADKEEREVNNGIITAVSNISSELMKDRRGHTLYRMNTVKDLVEERNIEEPEEYDAALHEILDTEARSSVRKTADYVMDNNSFKKYAKIIYVCPKTMYGETGIEDLEHCVVVQV